MALIGYVGWQGSGKTSGMIHDARCLFRRDRAQVFTNISSLRFPGAIYVNGIDALCSISSGLVLLDEAGVCLSSRNWQKLPQPVMMRLLQMRKNGLDLYWTSQHEARVDTTLRENTQQLVRSRRVGGVSIRYYEDPAAKVRLRVSLLRMPVETYYLYNDLEVIGTDGRGGRYPDRAWLTDAARTRASAEDRIRIQARTHTRRIYRFRPLTWQATLSRQGRSVRDWLTAEGLMRDNEPWAAQTASEIERRWWLSLFGLNWQDVPVTCSPLTPWAGGWSPDDVLAREAHDAREEAQDILRDARPRRAL